MGDESGRANHPSSTGPGMPMITNFGARGDAEATASAEISCDRIMARLEVLGLLDDLEMAQEVIDVFVYDAGQSLDELSRAVQTGDAKACERLAHRVKGSSLNLGVDELGDLACSLEEKGRSGNLSGAENLYAAMRRQYDTLCSIAPQILHRAA